MAPPARRQTFILGTATAIVLAVAASAAVLGPHPAYLLQRVVPFEPGAAGFVGLDYSVDEEELGLPSLGQTALCVESSTRRGCRYLLRLHLPGGRDHPVGEPMLWLERKRGGPDVFQLHVVAAIPVPSGLAPARLLPTEQWDVVALVGERDPNGWYPVRAAWRADTGLWKLHSVDPTGLRGYDPDSRPTGPLPPRPLLYSALAEGPLRDPPDVKRPSSTGPVSTDWGARGFWISHLYDITEGKDVLVVARKATVGVTDTEILPHDQDMRLVYGLVSDGTLREDLIGLLSTSARGDPDVVMYAWRLTRPGKLEPFPVDGLACRRYSEGHAGAGICANNYENLVAIRGVP